MTPTVRWLLFALSLALPLVAQSANRLALVIGNDRYATVAPLKNAGADAEAMAAALSLARYQVTSVRDLPLRDMQAKLREFKGRVNAGDEVVIFFAGHGVQIDNGVNYMLPVDIRGDSEDEVRDAAIPLQRVLDDMAERRAKFTLLVVDACRDNPFKPAAGKRSIGASRGLAPPSVSSGGGNGQMVVFSAGANQRALDSLGPTDPVRNGVFTRVFVEEMTTPGVPIDAVVNKVRSRVYKLADSVGHTQLPAVYNESIGEFFFMPGTAPAGTGPTLASVAPDPLQQELTLWNSVKDARDPAQINLYLNRYPRGSFVELAQARLKALGYVDPALAASGKRIELAPGQATRECPECPEIVAIGPGRLLLASAAGGPVEMAVARPFAIGRYEVTFAEWDACVADGGCSVRPSDNGWGRGRQPVVSVSYRDAQEYLTWLSRKTGARYRLPREAEWEYAAGGGSGSRYPWGDAPGSGNANCDGCGAGASERRRTVEVGRFGANRFGLFDMIGNAWEIVQDCHSPAVKAVDVADKDAGARCSAIVARGGSYNTAAASATVGMRREVAADVRSTQNGFRVARDLP